MAAPICYSSRLDDALQFTADAFRGARRKGSDVPYLAHLLQVMVFVAEHGGDEDQQIAALLHDYLEDIPGADREVLRARWGERVLRYVEALSDTTVRPKPPWEQRKLAYLRRLAKEEADIKLIATADKLHNAKSLFDDLETHGEAVWSRFNAPKARSLWYYRAVIAALGHEWRHPMLVRLHTEVDRLHQRAEHPWEPVALADLIGPR